MDYRLTDWEQLKDQDAVVRHLVHVDDEDMDEVIATFAQSDLGARIAEAALALANGEISTTDRIMADLLRAKLHKLQRENEVRSAEVERSALEDAVDRMGWPEINAYYAELNLGQGIDEDAGGYFLRALRRLFGLPSNRKAVERYQVAARAMIGRAA